MKGASMFPSLSKSAGVGLFKEGLYVSNNPCKLLKDMIKLWIE